MPSPRRRSSRSFKITPPIAERLLDNATLKAWRGWSMLRRVHQIEQDWGLRISYQTLSRFYKRHGISNMKAPFRWRTPTTDEERAVERRNWVALLVQHEMAGREIIYMDETSVSVWDHNVRTWMYRAEPLPHVLPKERAPNITVLGAISTKRPGLEYVFSHSTNQAAVAQLLKKVLRRSEDTSEVVVVWDNHSSHWSRGVAELIAEAGATLLTLPVNSSDLNQVERVWALLKSRWKRALYQHDGDLQPDEARALLDKVLREEVVPKSGNFAKGGRDIQLRALLGPGALGAEPVRYRRRRADAGGWRPNLPSPSRWASEGARRGVRY
jgi:transposase